MNHPEKDTYIPAPVDTTDVRLPDTIPELVELLSKNTHDVWAQERIAQGWSYGEKRDDTHKRHPCLVPYEDLSESEKKYDKQTVIETLKLIIKLGYKIEKVK